MLVDEIKIIPHESARDVGEMILVGQQRFDSDFLFQEFCHAAVVLPVGFHKKEHPFALAVLFAESEAFRFDMFRKFFPVDRSENRVRGNLEDVVFVDKADRDDRRFIFLCGSGVGIHMRHQVPAEGHPVLHGRFGNIGSQLEIQPELHIREIGDFALDEFAAHEEIKSNIDAALFHRGDQIVQTVDHDGVQRGGTSGVFQDKPVVEVMQADKVVADFRHLVGEQIGIFPVHEIDVERDVSSVEADGYAGAFFKLEVVACGFHKTVFSRRGVELVGKVDNRTFHRRMILDDAPLFSRSQNHWLLLRNGYAVIGECDAGDEPDSSVAGCFERQMIHRFVLNRICGVVDADDLQIGLSAPCDEAVFQLARMRRGA